LAIGIASTLSMIKLEGRGLLQFSRAGSVRFEPAPLAERKGAGARIRARRQVTLLSLRRTRDNSGSTLSELAPAFFFLFLFAIFPVLDMIVCGYNYCSCVALNDLQLREAAKIPRSLAESDTGPVKQDIPNNWKSTIVGGFANTPVMPVTDISYGRNSQNQGPLMVTISTTCTIQPFLSIPFFTGVPGLGSPMMVTITNKRILENPNNFAR